MSMPSAVADPIKPHVVIECLIFGEGVPVECLFSGPCLEIDCFTCPPEIVEACGAVDEFLSPKIITCSGGGSTALGMETKVAGSHLANEPGSSHWTVVFDSSVAPWELKSMNGHVRTALHSINIVENEETWTFGPLPMAPDVIDVRVRCTPIPFTNQGAITSTDHYARGFPLLYTEPGLVELDGTTCAAIC